MADAQAAAEAGTQFLGDHGQQPLQLPRLDSDMVHDGPFPDEVTVTTPSAQDGSDPQALYDLTGESVTELE
jgi:hypothetical protein